MKNIKAKKLFFICGWSLLVAACGAPRSEQSLGASSLCGDQRAWDKPAWQDGQACGEVQISITNEDCVRWFGIQEFVHVQVRNSNIGHRSYNTNADLPGRSSPGQGAAVSLDPCGSQWINDIGKGKTKSVTMPNHFSLGQDKYECLFKAEPEGTYTTTTIRTQEKTQQVNITCKQGAACTCSETSRSSKP